jgi:hypothetical protein
MTTFAVSFVRNYAKNNAEMYNKVGRRNLRVICGYCTRNEPQDGQRIALCKEQTWLAHGQK